MEGEGDGTGQQDGGQGAGQPSVEDRVTQLETGQNSLTGKVDQILGILSRGEGKAHTAARQHEEDKLDRPTAIGEQIRAQLEERDRKRAADDRERATGDRLGALEQTVRDLAEKQPEPPQRRSERVMWGQR